jgi:hypothetical protein
MRRFIAMNDEKPVKANGSGKTNGAGRTKAAAEV